MSQKNVEIVRSIYAGWERGDYSAVEWADPDVEFVLADGPSPGTYRGVVAMGRAWRDFERGIEDLTTFADEYRELDDERVLALTRFGARGAGSGVDVETRGAVLFHIREAKVKRLVRYWSAARAFADLGLEE